MQPDHPGHVWILPPAIAPLSLGTCRNATLVVDHFHTARLANAAIDDTRHRIQNETLCHRGRKTDPLYRARRVLLTGIERLSTERIGWRFDMLAAGDPYGEVGAVVMCERSPRVAIDDHRKSRWWQGF